MLSNDRYPLPPQAIFIPEQKAMPNAYSNPYSVLYHFLPILSLQVQIYGEINKNKTISARQLLTFYIDNVILITQGTQYGNR